MIILHVIILDLNKKPFFFIFHVQIWILLKQKNDIYQFHVLTT
jgi:hypothetical protein